MVKMTLAMIAVLLSALAVPAAPQTNTYSVQTWWSAAKPEHYPKVNPDRSIVFQVKAPDASAVNLLFGEWNVKPQPLTKNDSGIWTLTIGPIEPGLYQYHFTIDGAAVVDAGNPDVKVGQAIDASLVDVPGIVPRFDEIQNVPHGALHHLRYQSTVFGHARGLCVYVPPGYETGSKHYPALYLRHGGGDNENNWSREGRAGIILDNLIARHAAAPMLIVMTDGNVDGDWASASRPDGIKLLDEDLIKDVMPLVEKDYRVIPKADKRAIAGLSMGGGQAFVIGLNHLETFSWVGEFSSGLLADVNFKLDESVPAASNPAVINKRLHLLWLACGKDDPRYIGHQELVDKLKQKGINQEFHDCSGGHEWKVWRQQLNEFLQRLFKT